MQYSLLADRKDHSDRCADYAPAYDQQNVKYLLFMLHPKRRMHRLK